MDYCFLTDRLIHIKYFLSYRYNRSMNKWFSPPLLLEFQEPSSRREWRTDTTSTASWSIFSPSTSARGTPTPASGNGWSTSTGTLTARTWDILTCSTISPWPRTRAKRASASTWWRRCCSHVDPLRTNLTMPRSERAASVCSSSDVLMRFFWIRCYPLLWYTPKNAVFVLTALQNEKNWTLTLLVSGSTFWSYVASCAPSYYVWGNLLDFSFNFE